MHLPTVFKGVAFNDRCKCGYDEKEWADAVAAAKSPDDAPYPKAGGAVGACSST